MRLPDPIKKGLILYGDATHNPKASPELIEYGRLYLEEGRPNDALDFFSRAGFDEGIEEIVKQAVLDGDFFLYRRGMEFMGREMGKESLLRLAGNARKQGKFAFAREAYEIAGDDKAVKEVEGLMGKG